MHKLLQPNQEYIPNTIDSALLSGLLLENKARYADGSLIKPKKQEEIFNKRHKVIDPWRAEYLDAGFEQRDDGLYILFNHIIQPNNTLKPMNEGKLMHTLM